MGEIERGRASRGRVAASAIAAGIFAFGLARPAWATGMPNVDEKGVVLLFLFMLSLGCYAAYRQLPPLEGAPVEDAPIRSASFGSERLLPLAQLALTLLAAAIVAAGFLPAVFLVTFPLGFALVRRRSWSRLSFFALGVLISVPLCLFLLFLLLIIFR